MKRIILGVTVLFFSIIAVKAQVAITNDGSNADANTMLDIKSSNKGVKFPRLTTLQRKAIPITAADAGLMVFDTDRQVLYMYDGNDWLPFAVSVTPVGLIKKKMPPGLQSGSFGFSCAVSGDYAVVGAYNDSVGTTQAQGSAYVFKKVNGNWILQTRLVANDGKENDEFGYCVSVDGDYIAVGSINAYNAASVRTGAVYIYKLNGAVWDQHQKLTVADAGLKYFGISLHLQGNMLIAGSSAATVGINVEQGAAYVFEISGNLWALQKRLLASDGQANNRFGTSVTINNNDIIVGSYGAAYVFIKSGNLYSFQQKLLSTSQSNSASFGCSVSISNDVAIIGAWSESDGTQATGRAHIFKRTGATWTHFSAPSPITSKSDMRFGSEVIIKGDYVIITASQENIDDYVSQGSVYVYKWNGVYYDLIKRITDPNGFVQDRFGVAIGFDGTNFIIGAPAARRTAGVYNTGTVFFGSLNE